MDAHRVERISRAFAHRRFTRRRALAAATTGLAVGALTVADARSANAQGATPAIEQGSNTGVDGPAMLFVQTFQSGTIATVDGATDRYTLALTGGAGRTIYFSDRPARLVGSNATDYFLDTLGFPDDNPPNAALVVEPAPGETDIAVVELFSPVYDAAIGGVTYEVEVLENWEAELGVGLNEAPTDLATLASNFGTTHLFIDGSYDCPSSGEISCSSAGAVVGQIASSDFDGWCGWSSDGVHLGYCLPCDPRPAAQHGPPSGELDPGRPGNYRDVWLRWGDQCNRRFAECNGACVPLDWCKPDPYSPIPCPNNS